MIVERWQYHGFANAVLLFYFFFKFYFVLYLVFYFISVNSVLFVFVLFYFFYIRFYFTILYYYIYDLSIATIWPNGVLSVELSAFVFFDILRHKLPFEMCPARPQKQNKKNK